MIRTEELMLGNWVFHNDKPIKVDGILEDRIASFANTPGVILAFSIKKDDVNPIPITKEILEKCGYQFDYRLNHIRVFIKDGQYASLIKDTLYLSINGYEHKVKYLHQFQNLCFALTGQPLNIEL